jgi:hypothetical protein
VARALRAERPDRFRSGRNGQVTTHSARFALVFTQLPLVCKVPIAGRQVL